MAFDPHLLRLMAITDGLHANGNTKSIRNLIDRAIAAVQGGATCIQIRLKGVASRVIADITREIVSRVTVPVLVNDRFDIALATGAAGVHVGADDIPVADVRRLTPPGFIIGTSVGTDTEVTNATDADFVGIGPVYHTGSKADAGPAIGPSELIRLAHATAKPVIAIGGITAKNISTLLTPDVRHAGIAGIAVVSAIFSAPDSESAARTLRSLVDASTPNRSSL